MAESIQRIISELEKLDVSVEKRGNGYEVSFVRDPRAVQWLAKIPRILSIDAGGTIDSPQMLTADDWKGLGDQTALREIRIGNAGRFFGRDHAVFQHFTGLREFHHPGIREQGDEAVAEISRFERLEVLGIEQSKVSAAGMTHLRQLTRLKDLRISEIVVTGDLCKILPDCPLQDLTADGCRLNDADVQFLSRFSRLAGVSATDCLITDTGLREFGKMAMLRKLFLCGNSLSPTGLGEFIMRTSVESLWLSPDHVSGATVTALEHSAVKELVVSGSGCVPSELKRRLAHRFKGDSLGFFDEPDAPGE